jgi:catechol 2,3-dioxygenase-like lactoylglutathione lyase family enzyme
VGLAAQGAHGPEFPVAVPRIIHPQRTPAEGRTHLKETDMDWKIELIAVPVSDVDRAKEFYVDRVGFHDDYDVRVNEKLRFVQLTPPGSACSIAFGEGVTEMAPGTQRGIQIVVSDADEARAQLLEHGVAASDVDEQDWGRFVYFADPDGNTWSLQQLPARG